MSGLFGADVTQLRSLARAFETAATTLESDRMSVGNAIRISAWIGPVAVRFRAEWDSEYSTKVAAAAARLRAAAEALKRNADDQERTSAPDGGTRVDTKRSEEWPVARGESMHGPSGEGPKATGDFIRALAGMQGSEDGVRVQKIIGDDGVARFVVYINGTGSTADGPWGGDLGWDNVPSALVSFDSATLDHIREKIVAAIDDPQAEVAFVGFSQGGMLAQRLADESAVNCQVVLTYGSPTVQSLRNFGGADVIRLEHNWDGIAHSGLENPLHDVALGVLNAVHGVSPPEKGEDVTFEAGGPKFDPHSHADYAWVAEQFDDSSAEKFDAAKLSLQRFHGRVVADER